MFVVRGPVEKAALKIKTLSALLLQSHNFCHRWNERDVTFVRKADVFICNNQKKNFSSDSLCAVYVHSNNGERNVSVKFQLKIPHRSLIISFCKWATAPCPLFQILCKKHVWFWLSCPLRWNCVLKFKLLIYVFLNAHIRSTSTESSCHKACEY